MSSTVPPRRRAKRQTSAPSTLEVPSPSKTPATPTTSTAQKASSSPKDLQPSRGREAEEAEKTSVALVYEPVEAITPELARWIRLSAQDLRIRKRDRQWAAGIIKDFRTNLLKFLKKNDDQPYFQSCIPAFLNAGSYFEIVKIHTPNEFDMMLKMQPTSRLKMTKVDSTGLFYQLDLSQATNSPMQAFLLENKLTISASKFLNEIHRLVRKFLRTYQVPHECYNWVVNRKRTHSPAVTLSLFEVNNRSEELLSVDVVPAMGIHPSQGWPVDLRNGPDVDNWLGKKARRVITSNICYFVPKRPKGRNLSEAAKESWRISFSHVEKDIIKSHGNKKTCCETPATKCCRKQCFKLLKCLIEGLKQRFPDELDALHSYHGKTAFLHTLSIRFKDSQWAPQQLPACFLCLLGALQAHARSGLLPHFFVPSCNLFSPSTFPRKTLAFLTEALEEQKRQGLPLLKLPSPTMPLVELVVKTTVCITSHSLPTPSSQPQIVATTNCFNIGFMMKILVTFVIILSSVLLFV